MAETDPFASSDNLYSIAVLGSMNPAIHHPRWYLATKLLSEPEVSEAEALVQVPGGPTGEVGPSALMCSGVLSQFTFGAFRIMCLQQSWNITTTERSSFERARHICSGVFDALPHTPVSAYGLNFAFHRETKFEDVGKYLAHLLETLPLGLSPRKHAQASAASFRYHLKSGDDETIALVESSARSARKLFVGINARHQIREQGLFDLGPMLDRSFEVDLQDAESWLDSIVTNLTEQGGGH